MHVPYPSAEKGRARTAARRRASPRQLTDVKRDAHGLVAEIASSVTGRVDRAVRIARDGHDRVTRVDYGNGEVETFAYDRWGRLAAHTRGRLRETYAYDHFGRLAEKDENGTVFAYAYDAWGRRTRRTVRFADGGEAQEERRSYDRHGRLVEVAAFGTTVKWRYDAKGRIARQTVDGTPIDFAYTKEGRLAGKWLGGRERPDASVEYEYARDGRIVARTANGVRQTFEHDARGRLLAVKEGGRDVERYAYDRAGNMVRKTVRGRTTEFAFDGANQLVSSTADGVTTRYAYDAAGRLVKEGDRTYRYGYLDKVLSVAGGGKSFAYSYHADGQLARADYGDGRSEDFAWDGLALVRRGDERFVNEPHPGGGSPVLSSEGVAYLNDLLGTTVGAKKGRRYSAAALTAFGENGSRHTFFTGKPQVDGLGHAFLFRNYRAGLAKWQTADPLGYPDGWNQLAYCENRVLDSIDFLGGWCGSAEDIWHEYRDCGFETRPGSAYESLTPPRPMTRHEDMVRAIEGLNGLTVTHQTKQYVYSWNWDHRSASSIWRRDGYAYREEYYQQHEFVSITSSASFSTSSFLDALGNIATGVGGAVEIASILFPGLGIPSSIASGMTLAGFVSWLGQRLTGDTQKVDIMVRYVERWTNNWKIEFWHRKEE